MTDEPCNFWHWYPDPRFVLPPPSPLPGSDDLEPISSFSTMAPGVVLAATAPADKAICSAPVCKSTRLRRDCNRFRCKTHCMELGEGCRLPAHKVSGTASRAISQYATLPTLPPSTTSLPTIIDPALVSAAVQQPITSSSSGGPRHASHMAPIFTEQWATEQRLLEEKCASDALRLTHTQKSKQTVFVYVWAYVCYVLMDICTFFNEYRTE